MKSASAMAGYLPDEATAGAFDDGWYRTGDVGWLEPEGWVHLTDRCKEMIKVSGFQVAPAEIEAVLHGHPAVIDCAVFGVTDERAGEVPVAAVHLEPGSDVTADELERLVADTLATYKRVHHVVLVDAIPRTPSGKVLRRTLRDEWAPDVRGGRGATEWTSASHPNRSPCASSAAQVVDRLGVHRVADLDDRERAAKLDAAVSASGWRDCGRRRTTGRRGPLRSRSPSSPRSSVGVWPMPPFSARPGRGAPSPDRGAGGGRARDGRPDRRPRAGRPRPRAGGCRRERSRSTRTGRPPRSVLEGAADGYTIGAAALEGETVGIDLTRPTASWPAPAAVTAVERAVAIARIPTTWRRGAASASP